MGGEGGVSEFFYGFNLFLLATKEHMQIFKIIALLLLFVFWLNLKFTLKYITVGGEGGVLEFALKFQPYSFGHSWAHAKFQNRSFTPSRLNLNSPPNIAQWGVKGGY